MTHSHLQLALAHSNETSKKQKLATENKGDLLSPFIAATNNRISPSSIVFGFLTVREWLKLNPTSKDINRHVNQALDFMILDKLKKFAFEMQGREVKRTTPTERFKLNEVGEVVLNGITVTYRFPNSTTINEILNQHQCNPKAAFQALIEKLENPLEMYLLQLDDKNIESLPVMLLLAPRELKYFLPDNCKKLLESKSIVLRNKFTNFLRDNAKKLPLNVLLKEAKRYLDAGVNPNGRGLLSIATELDQAELIQLLVSRGAKASINALKIAAHSKNIKLLQLLVLNAGAERQNKLDKTLREAIEVNNEEAVRFLVQQGASVNYIDPAEEVGYHCSQLRRALDLGHYKIAKLLIEEGHATITREDLDGVVEFQYIDPDDRSGVIRRINQNIEEQEHPESRCRIC